MPQLYPFSFGLCVEVYLGNWNLTPHPYFLVLCKQLTSIDSSLVASTDSSLVAKLVPADHSCRHIVPNVNVPL